MSRLDDFQAALASIDAETTRIGNRINELVAQLTRTDLTAAEEQVVLDELNASAERLKSVGTEPVPEV